MTVVPTEHVTRYSIHGASNRGCGSFSQKDYNLNREGEYHISTTQFQHPIHKLAAPIESLPRKQSVGYHLLGV